MATLEQIDEKLDSIEDTMIELKTVLLGKNSDKGLVGQVEENCEQIDKLKGNYKTLVGILIGSGIFTGGVVAGLTKLLGG